jgi:hypothetical protein
VGVSILAGGLVFAVAARLFRVSELDQFIGMIERRLGRKQKRD